MLWLEAGQPSRFLPTRASFASASSPRKNYPVCRRSQQRTGCRFRRSVAVGPRFLLCRPLRTPAGILRLVRLGIGRAGTLRRRGALVPRGRGLHLQGLHAAGVSGTWVIRAGRWPRSAGPGGPWREQLLATVEWTNWASLKSCYRLGYVDLGAGGGAGPGRPGGSCCPPKLRGSGGSNLAGMPGRK